MIGGKVIEIAARADGNSRLWVVGIHGDEPRELWVTVQNDTGVRMPNLGETVWWQSGRVYYGGPDRAHGEISLRKIGYSGAPNMEGQVALPKGDTK